MKSSEASSLRSARLNSTFAASSQRLAADVPLAQVLSKRFPLCIYHRCAAVRPTARYQQAPALAPALDRVRSASVVSSSLIAEKPA